MKRTHAEALQTKQAIINAARKIFTQRGFAKATLSDIAREANVTRGAIYWHFDDKSELLSALLEDEATRVNIYTTLRQAVEDNQRDPLGTLKRWALYHLTEDAERLFISNLASTVDQAMVYTGNSDVREKVIDMIRDRTAVVSAALRSAVAQKQLPIDLDVEAATCLLCSFLSGIIDLYRLGLLENQMGYYKNVIEVIFDNLGNLKKPYRSY